MGTGFQPAFPPSKTQIIKGKKLPSASPGRVRCLMPAWSPLTILMAILHPWAVQVLPGAGLLLAELLWTSPKRSRTTGWCGFRSSIRTSGVSFQMVKFRVLVALL